MSGQASLSLILLIFAWVSPNSENFNLWKLLGWGKRNINSVKNSVFMTEENNDTKKKKKYMNEKIK